MFTRASALIGYALISGAAFAASPVLEDIVKPCAECHGPAGVGTAPQTPHLNGQLAGYLEQEISALAGGDRQSTVANHVPKTWSAKEISAVAKFYASSNATRQKEVTDPQKVAKGAEIYNKRCAECHADNGRGSDKDAPLMAAQSLEYMSAQTRLFVSGKRKFPYLMDDSYRGLNAEELESVSHFFASQDQFGAPSAKKSRRK